MEEVACVCDYLLEKGKTLYVQTDWQGGIAFDEIKDIRFCPCCGKELETWQEESYCIKG